MALDDSLSQEAQTRYRAALQHVSPADRELIVLRVEQESTYEAIAERCGLQSATQARVSVSRALMRLASVMSGLPEGPAPIVRRHSRMPSILRLLSRWPWRDPNSH